MLACVQAPPPTVHAPPKVCAPLHARLVGRGPYPIPCTSVPSQEIAESLTALAKQYASQQTLAQELRELAGKLLAAEHAVCQVYITASHAHSMSELLLLLMLLILIIMHYKRAIRLSCHC